MSGASANSRRWWIGGGVNVATVLGAIGGLCAVLALCALSYWIGRMVQAAADFDALAEALTPPEGADDLASDHWGVP